MVIKISSRLFGGAFLLRVYAAGVRALYGGIGVNGIGVYDMKFPKNQKIPKESKNCYFFLKSNQNLGLNENGPPRLICWNTWSLDSGLFGKD